jgi:2'-5' RNA ligase
VRAATASVSPFTAALGAPGAFPASKKARVLWLGLSVGAEELVALARAVEGALERSGFGRAERPFAPHLTIGRVRAPGRDWGAVLAEAARADTRPPLEFPVRRVVVVHSTLSPKGSVYRVSAEAPLGS